MLSAFSPASLSTNVVSPALKRLYALVEADMREQLSSGGEHIFKSVDEYFTQDPHMYGYLVEQGRHRVIELSTAQGWGITHDHINTWDTDFLALHAILESTLCVGVDLTKSDIPAVYLTRNKDILQTLTSNGQLVGNPDMMMSLLNQYHTHHALLANKHHVYSIDFDKLVGHLETYESKRVGQLKISQYGDWALFPIEFYHIFANVMRTHFADTFFEVRYNVNQVERVKYGAVSDSLVANFRHQRETGLLARVPLGLDWSSRTYRVLSPVETLQTTGTFKFRPEQVNGIKPVQLDVIPAYLNNVDERLLRGIVKTKVNGAPKSSLEQIALLDASSYATADDMRTAIHKLVLGMDIISLYVFMSTNPQVFGSVEQAVKTRYTHTPKELKDFRPLRLASDIGKRHAQLISELKQGVVSVIYRKTDGSYQKAVVTNDSRVLKKVYGIDYVQRFESISNRLSLVRGSLSDGHITTVRHLEEYGVKYNILDYLDRDLYFSRDIESGDISKALYSIDNALHEIRVANAERREQVDLQQQSAKSDSQYNIVCRKLDASSPKSYYTVINASRVVSVLAPVSKSH